ncbi:MAG: HAMP domain-containing sensor histidine kinase [Polyangiaceae bacterium]
MKRRTLRGRTYAVVLAVALFPLAVVLIADRSGDGETSQMSRAAADAAAAVAADLERGADPPATAEREAASHRVRILVITPDGHVSAADHDGATSLRDRIGDALFGPEGAPTLRAFDESRAPQTATLTPPLSPSPSPAQTATLTPPLSPSPSPAQTATLTPALAAASWPEVRRARETGHDAGCVIALSGTLAVCHSAALVNAKGAVVLAQKSSPRAIRALSDLRYPLLKLTLYVLVVGAALAAWLGRRILSPVERLRGEVLDRVGDPLRAPPIPRVSRDEIGDLGDAFNTLLTALVHKSRANEAFAADLAHELKSPIAALRAATDALSGPVDEARARKLARVVGDSTARLDAVVTRFLELARAEAGLPGEERTPVDLTALLRGLTPPRFEVSGDPTVVSAAAGPVETAFRNIVENAASFAGEAGKVTVRVSREPLAAVVEITDSGPGIPPENLPRVFDRFFTDRPDGAGTGLGLSYSKAVFEAHGGSIHAENAPPPATGAVFTVRLPAVSHDFHAPPSDDSPRT